MQPIEFVSGIERAAELPPGRGDRFSGYAVLGQPFRSGHVLALRRFPASSVGPGYTSVWHRDPQNHWTFYSTVVPEQGCSRYFGRAVARNVMAPIDIHWLADDRFCVRIADDLRWEIALAESVPTRCLNALARLLPESAWQRPAALRAMSLAAQVALGAGRLNLAGKTPNGQTFFANPRRVWLIAASRASLRGRDLGAVGPLDRQARLNDFLIPQVGLFAIASATLYPELR